MGRDANRALPAERFEFAYRYAGLGEPGATFDDPRSAIRDPRPY